MNPSVMLFQFGYFSNFASLNLYLVQHELLIKHRKSVFENLGNNKRGVAYA